MPSLGDYKYLAAYLARSDGVSKKCAYFDGLTQYLRLSAPITIPASADFEVSVEVSGIKTNAYQSIFSGSSINNFFRTLVNGTGIQAYIGGGVVSWRATGFDVDAFHKYGLKRVGGTVSILVDDVEVASRQNINNEMEIDRLMRSWTTSNYTSGMVKNFKVWINGALTNSIPVNQELSRTQRADTGSVTAEIVNYTDAMWR